MAGNEKSGRKKIPDERAIKIFEANQEPESVADQVDAKPVKKKKRFTAPSFLSRRAKLIFNEVRDNLDKIGVLWTLDRDAVTNYAEAKDDWLNAIETIAKDGAELYEYHPLKDGETEPQLKTIRRHPAVARKKDAFGRMQVATDQLGYAPRARAILASKMKQRVMEGTPAGETPQPKGDETNGFDSYTA